MIEQECLEWIFEAPDTYRFDRHSPEEFLKMDIDPRDPLRQMWDTSVTSVRIRNEDDPDTIGPYLRQRLVQGGGKLTDLYGLPMLTQGRYMAGITWSTECPTGWSEEQIAFFDHCMPMLDMTLNLILQRFVMDNLLCTYLGKDPGSRVSKGSVFRGKGVTVRSVLWFSDVRGYTTLSSHLERDAVIELINDVFELTEEVLNKHGGEILKFMGDGILAIFREPDGAVDSGDNGDGTCKGNNNSNAVANDQQNDNSNIDKADKIWMRASLPYQVSSSICSNGSNAAEEFQRRLAELSKSRIAKGLPGVEVGVGLHYGDCSYGNVGAPSRLDFTVIGNSVNVASRVESLCSKLGASILATDDFIQRLSSGRRDWAFKGEHLLKGVTDPVGVHELQLRREES